MTRMLDLLFLRYTAPEWRASETKGYWGKSRVRRLLINRGYTLKHSFFPSNKKRVYSFNYLKEVYFAIEHDSWYIFAVIMSSIFE